VKSRGTPVLLGMKRLLLLLWEGKKLKFCSSDQRNHKGQKSRYRGGRQTRGGRTLIAVGTQVWTLEFLRKMFVLHQL